MKVNLIKEAIYELNEKKSSPVPFDTFLKMASIDASVGKSENLPKVRIFEGIDEFKQTENFEQYDSSKDVFILKNGQVCVFLKERENDVVNLAEENVTADTQEDSGEEA